MAEPTRLATISIVGKKNSGKTTLTVALAAELRRRGLRVASMKHGHHAFELDREESDSWRHFHDGGVEAVLFAATGKVALIERHEAQEPDPQELIERFFSGRGLDLVLVEGYKHGPFPKIEIHRRAAHDRAVYDPADPVAAALFLAIVTDDVRVAAACPVIPLDAENPNGSHVVAIADLIMDLLPARPAEEE